MADRVGLHVNQIRRYGAERGSDEDPRLQFEAVSRMPHKDERIIKATLKGMIVKYQVKQLAGGLSR